MLGGNHLEIALERLAQPYSNVIRAFLASLRHLESPPIFVSAVLGCAATKALRRLGSLHALSEVFMDMGGMRF